MLVLLQSIAIGVRIVATGAEISCGFAQVGIATIFRLGRIERSLNRGFAFAFRADASGLKLLAGSSDLKALTDWS